MVNKSLTTNVCCVMMCVALSPLSTLAEDPQPRAKRTAVLVGINEYDHLPDLAYAERDVQELARTLEAGGYDVHLLTGSLPSVQRATGEVIRKVIDDVLSKRAEDELILFAFAGHGGQEQSQTANSNRRQDCYFCPQDADRSDRKTLIQIGDLFDEFHRRNSGPTLLLVDACRDDPVRGRGMDGSTVEDLPEGVAMLLGCRSGQQTFETERAGGGHGVFFYYVLEGLRGKAKNEDGEVTWSRLTEYVSRKVSRNAPQLVNDFSIQQTPNLVVNIPGPSPILLAD